MKARIYQVLDQPYVVALTMLFAPCLSYFDRNFSYFFGLGIALLLLWGSNWDWSKFGFGHKINAKTVLKSLWITALLLLVFYSIEPILESYLGAFNLSSLEHIKHNFASYITLMAIVWIFAAFGEEFLFRGYYMKGLAELFGNGNKSWIISALIVSLYFGVSHAYQGLVGIVSVALWSFCISLIFAKNRNRLGLLVLIHGFYDTVGLTLLYLDKDLNLWKWMQHIFNH